MNTQFEIIDISQPIAGTTACFPGDTPFSRQITAHHSNSGVINLSAFTMSPHIGTHADAPIHIHGDMANPDAAAKTIGQLGLSAFIGPAMVVDVSPWHEAITWEQIEDRLTCWPELPARVLFKTQPHNQAEQFKPPYAWPAETLIPELARRGIVLIGIDTPSVDPVDSKTLDTHHALLKAGMVWLENLDLTLTPETLPSKEPPVLIALPLKLMELEASPIRAVLLTHK